MYKLKPNVPDFEIVDGPLAGRKYEAGKIYTEIPANERHKFDPEFEPINPVRVQNPDGVDPRSEDN